MNDVKKVVRDGKVAVLVSPGYGAGWSTWGGDAAAKMYCPELVAAVEANEPHEALKAIAARLFPTATEYDGGLRQLRVEWVPVGTRFHIHEYDGSETLKTDSDVPWEVA